MCVRELVCREGGAASPGLLTHVHPPGLVVVHGLVCEKKCLYLCVCVEKKCYLKCTFRHTRSRGKELPTPLQARHESCSLWSIAADIVHRSPFYSRTTPQSRRVRRQDRQLASHRAAGGRPRNTPYQTVPRSLSCYAECRSSRPSPRSRCRPSRRASCLHRRGRRVNTVSLDRMNAHSEGRAIVRCRIRIPHLRPSYPRQRPPRRLGG